MQEKPPTRRRLTRRGKVVLSIALVLILLLAGILYSQRHQIHQMVRNLTLPPAQAVQITPLTLTATAYGPRVTALMKAGSTRRSSRAVWKR